MDRENNVTCVGLNLLQPEMFSNSSGKCKKNGGIIFSAISELYELSLLNFDCCSIKLHRMCTL